MPEGDAFVGFAGGDAEELVGGIFYPEGDGAAELFVEDYFAVHGALYAEVGVAEFYDLAVAGEYQDALHAGGVDGVVGAEDVVEVLLVLIGAEFVEGVPLAGHEVVEMDVAGVAVGAEAADFEDGVVVDGACVLVAAAGEGEEAGCRCEGDGEKRCSESGQGLPLSRLVWRAGVAGLLMIVVLDGLRRLGADSVGVVKEE